MKHVGENVVRIEAAALQVLADRIAGPMADAFNRAVELLYHCSGALWLLAWARAGLLHGRLRLR